jgi:hypothetical protein
VPIAGSSGRRPRPAEALEEAMAVTNRGLELAIRIDASLARVAEFLEHSSADQRFRLGYHD